MKNNFSLTRFWQFAKAEVMSSKRFILLFLGSAFGLFLLIYGFNHLILYDSIVVEHGSEMFVEGAVGFVWFSIVAITVVLVSRSFRNYYHKGYANSAIMLPVSQSEKFAFSLILYNLVVPVALIALAAINDFIWTAAYGIDFSFIPMNDPDFRRICVPMIFGGIFLLSQYFLGAVLFRRYQLLFSIIIINLISVTFGVVVFWLDKIGVPLSKWIDSFIRSLEGLGDDGALLVIKTIWCVIFILGTAVLWYVSWRRFRKLQITK